MESKRVTTGIAIVFLLMLNPAIASAQDLDGNLAALRPLLGKAWEGKLQAPGGGASWPTVCEYSAMWGGKAVRYAFSTPQIDDHSEGYLYWDAAEKAIGFLILHKSGVTKRGVVAVEDGLLTMRGKIAFPDRVFDFRNTFEFPEDGAMIDRWYQNAFGSWRQGHQIEFREATR